MTYRYFLEVSYEGTAFHGSQIQGTLPTVQLALNKAIAVLIRREIETFGASRTDEGVHALSNFYHFDLDAPIHPQFRYKINAILPPTMAVKRVYEARDPDLNARFAATARQYRYRIYTQKDPFRFQRAMYYPYHTRMEVLHETAAIIKEHTDFESFCKRNSQAHTFICQIFNSHWEEQDGELQYVVQANRFLRGMVRGLVGTQLKIARGKGSADDIRKILAAKDCTKADFSVPGHGLYLEEIVYPEGALILLNQ